MKILEEKEEAARKMLQEDKELVKRMEEAAASRHSTNQMLAEGRIPSANQNVRI